MNLPPNLATRLREAITQFHTRTNITAENKQKRIEASIANVEAAFNFGWMFNPRKNQVYRDLGVFTIPLRAPNSVAVLGPYRAEVAFESLLTLAQERDAYSLPFRFSTPNTCNWPRLKGTWPIHMHVSYEGCMCVGDASTPLVKAAKFWDLLSIEALYCGVLNNHTPNHRYCPPETLMPHLTPCPFCRQEPLRDTDYRTCADPKCAAVGCPNCVTRRRTQTYQYCPVCEAERLAKTAKKPATKKKIIRRRRTTTTAVEIA